MLLVFSVPMMSVCLSVQGCPVNGERGQNTSAKPRGVGRSCPDAPYLSSSRSGFQRELFQAKELKTQTHKEQRAPVKNSQLFLPAGISGHKLLEN